MGELRDRFDVLEQVEMPDIWRRVEALGPRRPGIEDPSTTSRIVVAIAALVIAGAGIGLVVNSLWRTATRSRPGERAPAPTAQGPSPAQPTSPFVPADAIIFASAPSDSLDAQIEVSFVPAAGGPVTPLTTAGSEGMVAAEPRWSPDGSRIAFVMSPQGHLTRYAGDGDIYVMDAQGTDARRITVGLDASAPTWSPDGSRIAFVRNQGTELVVMKADGSDQQVIASRRGYYQSPSWSPDGTAIAYQSTVARNQEATAVFTIRPDGTGEHLLSDGGTPAWSPDGSKIAYSLGDRLWIMDADGRHAHEVKQCPLPSCVADFAPAWAPDGRHLVFVQQEDGGAARRLYVLDLATGRVTSLTPDERWAGGPSWRP